MLTKPKLRLRCPTCGRPLSVSREQAGKRGQCPGCKAIIQGPARALSARSAPSTDFQKLLLPALLGVGGGVAGAILSALPTVMLHLFAADKLSAPDLGFTALGCFILPFTAVGAVLGVCLGQEMVKRLIAPVREAGNQRQPLFPDRPIR